MKIGSMDRFLLSQSDERKNRHVVRDADYSDEPECSLEVSDVAQFNDLRLLAMTSTQKPLCSSVHQSENASAHHREDAGERCKKQNYTNTLGAGVLRRDIVVDWLHCQKIHSRSHTSKTQLEAEDHV